MYSLNSFSFSISNFKSTRSYLIHMYYIYYCAAQYTRHKHWRISYHNLLAPYPHHILLHRIGSYRITLMMMITTKMMKMMMMMMNELNHNTQNTKQTHFISMFFTSRVSKLVHRVYQAKINKIWCRHKKKNPGT